MSAARDDTLDALRDALRGTVEVLAEHLLGERNQRLSSRRTRRWGARGSVAVELSGAQRGAWFDHEAGTGGGPLELVRHIRRCGFREAVAWAQEWLGTPAPERRPARRESAAAAARRERQATAEAAEAAAKQARARRLWAAAVPVEETVAERYLVDVRRIPRPSGGWPADAMRWHAGEGAWVLAVRDPAGELVAIQRVFLTAEGQKRPDAAGVVKRSLGAVAAGVVRLPGRLPVLIAEGPETAAALWSATGHETWAALGGTSRLTPPAFALLAADDDRPHSPADKARRRALRAWARAGLDVLPVLPWPVRRGDGRDFADLLAAEGPEAVRARIALALDPGAAPVRRVPLPIARVRLDRAAQAFAAAAEAAEAGAVPPVQAIRVDLGAGKSHAARRELVALVRRLRARGDMRTVALAVPEHGLAAEAAAALAELAPDLAVRVWRGRERPAPGRDGSMCQDLARVAEARRLRLDVMGFACRDCPFAQACDYLAQHKARADLWVVPAAMLHQQRPKALGELAALVVDEDPGPALEGVKEIIRLPVTDLARYDAIERDRLASQRLASLRRLVLDALAELPDGPVPRDAFTASGMTADSARELLALEWRTLIEPKLPPGAAPAARAKALAEAARNADLGRRVMLAHALAALLAADGPQASGLTELRTAGSARELHLRARRELHGSWRVPTLLLDATLNMALVRHTWPAAELVADLAVEAPHQRVRQITDAAFSLSALDADDPRITAEERRRRERNLLRLHATLHAEARRHAGRVLVVSNKRVRARLEGMGLPGNVEMAHFKKLRGLDRWRDVAALIVVGRPLPPAAAMSRAAATLTGAAVPATDYQRAEAFREMADGTREPAETWRHPDPLAEALRWAACEAEVVQAIGRARGVSRGPGNPVAVLVLGDLPLPMPVELQPCVLPSPDDLQLAAGGLACREPAHAARAYPNLWRSGEAARKAWQRCGTFPYGETPIGECPAPRRTVWRTRDAPGCAGPGLVHVRYQLAGAGHRPAVALVDLARCPDPRAALERALGALAVCEIEAPPAVARPATAPQRPAAGLSAAPDVAALPVEVPPVPARPLPWGEPTPHDIAGGRT
ncbi:MAG: toprim domain-containing protein [Acetobacteraceae bacterium]|nr:toprim domain-containing protein [Acetobacteraceae bacterium]